MHIRGVIQSTEITELTATGDDTAAARALLLQQLPDGYELIQVSNQMRGGSVIATGRIRPLTSREIDADGENYAAAHRALRAAVPAGWRLLHMLTVEG